MGKTKKDLIEELNKYKKLSLLDHLTGLYNRRKLDIDIKYYRKLIKRYKENYELVLIDMDKFKEINDTKGHLKGDKILQKVANILKTNIRETDSAYRLGGDEFIVILRDLYASSCMNRLKTVFRNKNIKLSMGCASLSDENAIKKADKAMYYIKRRKQLCTF